MFLLKIVLNSLKRKNMKEKDEKYTADMKSSQEKSFDEIYNMYFKRMVQYCYYKSKNCTELSEEITQNAFLELYVKWNTISCHSEEVLVAWLQHTIRNMLANHFRKRKKDPDSISYEEYICNNQITDKETFFEREYTYEDYMEKIEKHLSPDEFLLFQLFVIEKLTLAQISSFTDTNLNTTKSRWRRLSYKLKILIHNMKN